MMSGLCLLLRQIGSHADNQRTEQHQHHQGKGQGARHGGGLQGAQAAGNEQDGRNQALERAPEETLSEGRFRFSARSDHVHHDRTGIGRGDEEDRDEDDGDGGRDAG
jgi:hypothetical protein